MEHVLDRSDESESLARAVFQHAEKIAQTSSLDELISLNADFAREITSADRCSIWLVDEANGVLWTVLAHDSAPLRIGLNEGLVGACATTSSVVLVDDASKDPAFCGLTNGAKGFYTKQVLCIPMLSGFKAIGVVQLLNKGGGFNQQDVRVVTMLAHFAATAIESERLRIANASSLQLHREVQLARDVQDRLLPTHFPRLPHAKFYSLCQPALVVGGDFYDVVLRGNGDVAFSLGDVSGKGIAAAVTMASIQTLLRSLLRNTALDLPSIVSALNRALHESSPPERYSTLFCGLLDTRRRTLHYVNAGQVPPLIAHKGGSTMSLGEGDLPIGLFPEIIFTQHSVTLEPGTAILLFSDGVTECENSEGESNESDVGQQALSMRDCLGDDKVLDRLGVLLSLWRGDAKQSDDITALLICVE